MINERAMRLPARSSVPGVEWPPIPDPDTAVLTALVAGLAVTEWWSTDELARHQRRQLAVVMRHAATTTPFYADRLREAGDDWTRVPIATRDDLVAAGDALQSRACPPHHGRVDTVLTSRTSGEPVRVSTTGMLATFWAAITLRDHAWHQRDLDAKLAAIRYTGDQAAAPDGIHAVGWGMATAPFAPAAPLAVLSVAATTDEHVAWLLREAPDYLLVYPTVLEAILRRLAATGARLPSLREVRTISEALSPDTRALCREVLGVPLVDTYSAQEVGYIALQCPAHAHYHVQAERLIVEILDDADRPCAPGAIGRVVVTDLHNFATPIIRYDLGDYAEVGGACPCGRGLPVLTRILGRRRGMLTYPDGRTAWPVFTAACRRAARYREIQLVQDSVTALRLRVVPDGPLDAAERAALADALRACLDHPFAVEIEVVTSLGRTAAGKLEEFVSRLG
jgi:phenylacetate-CoA ligase